MPIVIGAVAGVLGAILTIFLTPALQHYLWKSQRREELRFAAINEANRSSAEFITKYMRKVGTRFPAEISGSRFKQ